MQLASPLSGENHRSLKVPKGKGQNLSLVAWLLSSLPFSGVNNVFMMSSAVFTPLLFLCSFPPIFVACFLPAFITHLSFLQQKIREYDLEVVTMNWQRNTTQMPFFFLLLTGPSLWRRCNTHVTEGVQMTYGVYRNIYAMVEFISQFGGFLKTRGLFPVTSLGKTHYLPNMIKLGLKIPNYTFCI